MQLDGRSPDYVKTRNSKIEAVTLAAERERERAQLEGQGELEVARLRQRAELLGRTSQLEGEECPLGVLGDLPAFLKLVC